MLKSRIIKIISKKAKVRKRILVLKNARDNALENATQNAHNIATQNAHNIAAQNQGDQMAG